MLLRIENRVVGRACYAEFSNIGAVFVCALWELATALRRASVRGRSLFELVCVSRGVVEMLDRDSSGEIQRFRTYQPLQVHTKSRAPCRCVFDVCVDGSPQPNRRPGM